jgi:NADH-quinone oxidoreductase subunit E
VDRQISQGTQASAVIPLLWRAQEQHDGWLPERAIEDVADMLDMPYIRVLEVATFYTMFQLSRWAKKPTFRSAAPRRACCAVRKS